MEECRLFYGIFSSNSLNGFDAVFLLNLDNRTSLFRELVKQSNGLMTKHLNIYSFYRLRK